jgi:transposase
MSRMKTDLAGPLVAQLYAWQGELNPLVRPFSEPFVEKVTGSLLQMQAVIDRQAVVIDHQTVLNEEQTLVIEQLRAEIETLRREHALALQVTKDRIDQLERDLYGKKSERRARTPDARREARERRRKEQSDEEKRAQREAAAKRRKEKLEALRTETLVIPLTPTTGEASGGRPLPPEESVIYEWRRGELVRIVIQREQLVMPSGAISTAPPPPQVIEGGSYGPALHAKIAMDKCLDAMPLRRQERAFARRGIPLPISVLCALFHRSATIVEPLYKAMVAEIGAAEHVSADETPQPVLAEGQVRKGWMWVFASESVILFTFSPSRGGTVPDAVLGRSTGTLTVDGHTGYNIVTAVGRRKRGGCWSHGRRGLFEARDYAEEIIDCLLADISELYYIEQVAIERQIVGTAEHLALRQAESAPVLSRIFATVEAHVDRFDARSSIAKAMRYLLNQREPLSLFLSDARVPIHNNLSERALRIVALLRKNALFVGSDEGGQDLAMLLTMAATCQLHGVDPEAWLEDVLIRIGERGSTVEELLPWVWKTGRGLQQRGLLGQPRSDPADSAYRDCLDLHRRVLAYQRG